MSRWVLAAVTVLAAGATGCPAPSAAPAAGPRRIVSLAPSITDTLFAIGAGSEVVGRSDHCDHPAEARALPKVGTSLRPDLEAILRLAPTLVLGERSVAGQTEQLGKLAPTELLPWLEGPDVVQSIRRLGVIVGREGAADALAARFELALAPPPAMGPRVLLALAHEGRLTECWYIRRNSLHGALLHAAGARNAIDRDVSGQPSASLEELHTIDPDVIVLLSFEPEPDAASRERLLGDWRQLGALRAVREGRVAIVGSAAALATGPRALDLVEPLRAAIQGATAR